MFKLFGVTSVGAGGVVGYAWYDPQFRQTLESNIPDIKPILDPLFEMLPDPPKELPIPRPL